MIPIRGQQMKRKFSDRIGVTTPRAVLQTEEMSDELKSSIWNFIIKTIFAVRPEHWPSSVKVIAERFYKVPLDVLQHSTPSDHRGWLRSRFFEAPWYEVYNLIEFIAENCKKMNPAHSPQAFMLGINRVLEEEMSGYRFIGGVLSPITKEEELASIEESLALAEERELYGTKQHLVTAIELMSKRPSPDFRNSIKESISGIESLVKQITGEEGGGLDKALTKLDEVVQFHGAFKAGLLSLYGFLRRVSTGCYDW
jgi:hypothetical protein